MKKKLCVMLCGLATTSLLFTGCGNASTGSDQATIATDDANMETDAKQPGGAPEGEEPTEMMNGDMDDQNKEKNAESIKTGTITEITSDTITIEAMAGDADMNKLSMEKPSEKEAPQGEAPQGEAPQGEAPQGEPPQGGAPSGDKPDGNGGPQKDAPAGNKPDGNNAPQDSPTEELSFTITDDTVINSENGETITVDELSEGIVVTVETDDDNNAITITIGMPSMDDKELSETEGVDTESTEDETETTEN